MRMRTRRSHPVLFSYLLTVGLAACGSPAAEAPDRPVAPGIGVAITATNCPAVTISVGTQVMWTNQDRRDHTLHSESPGGGVLFDSGTLHPGDTFTFRFAQQGAYPYRCGSEQRAMGMITVQP